MSHNTRTQNSGQDADPRRNNPPQYNLCPLRPQVEEQEGDELPTMVEMRAARRQPCREMRTKSFEQRLNTLTELVSTLVVAFGENEANMAPAIPLGIPFANRKGRDATASESRTDTSARRRRAWCKHRNIVQAAREDREPTPESL